MENKEFIDKLKKEIGFFNEKAKFWPMQDSNSGAMVWKVTDNGHDYLLKVMDKNSSYLNNFINIVKMYKACQVNSIKLVSYGFIENKCYIIYDFIDGKPLNNLYDVMDKKSFQNFGVKIGKEYSLINESFFDTIAVRDYDITNLTNDTIKKFLNVYHNNLSYLQEIINLQNMDILIKRMKILASTFNNEKKVIIHSDMHPKNIILDKDNKLFIIDVDATAYDYFVMNLRYSLMAAFKKAENKEFFKGFIRGFYQENVPAIFYQQLLYVLILNFMEHIILFSKNKDKEYIIEYTTMVNKVFDNLKIFDEDIYNNDKLINVFS